MRFVADIVIAGNVAQPVAQRRQELFGVCTGRTEGRQMWQRVHDVAEMDIESRILGRQEGRSVGRPFRLPLR